MLTDAPADTPTLPPAAAPTGTRTAAPRSLSRVAIARDPTYERGLVRDRLRGLLDGLGGLDDIVSAGKRVAIKVNLVGGTHFEPPPGVLAVESYLTHPELVRALGSCCATRVPAS